MLRMLKGTAAVQWISQVQATESCMHIQHTADRLAAWTSELAEPSVQSTSSTGTIPKQRLFLAIPHSTLPVQILSHSR